MKIPRTCGLGLVAVLLATLANVAMAAPGYACACGAIVPPTGGQAAMNHEVALLHWNGSSETIVMQLALNADTNNVALVVPTPTPAIVTEGDKETFAELDTLTAPPSTAAPALGPGRAGCQRARATRRRSGPPRTDGRQPGSARAAGGHHAGRR